MPLNFNLDQLQTLKAILEEGGFRGAAEKLHKAQSAISYQIKSLEEAVGFELLDRSQYRAQLTEKGRVFYEHTLLLLRQADSLSGFAKQLQQGVEGSVHLSSSALYPIESLFEVLRDFEIKFPKTRLKLSSDILSGAQRLQLRLCDLAIVEGSNTQYMGNFETLQLGRICLVPVASANHPLVQKQNLSMAELMPYKHIVVRSTELSNEDPKAAIHEEATTWSVSDFATKLKLLQEGLGWGLMPKYMVREQIEMGALGLLSTQDYKDIGLDFCLISRREKHGPATSHLLQRLSALQQMTILSQ